MEKVYVLIKVEPGTLEGVLKGIERIKGVAEVSAVTGPYDLIAKVEGDYITDALGVVVRDLRAVKGIANTETLVAVKI